MPWDDYGEHFDALDDPEAYKEWNAAGNQIEHTCDACGQMFRAHYSRGKLGFCDRCADILEMGGDPYA